MDNSRAKQTELYRRWTRGEIGPGEAVEDSRPRAVRGHPGPSGGTRRSRAGGRWRWWPTAACSWGCWPNTAGPDRSYYDWLLPNCGGYRVTLETDPLELLVTGTVGQVREENRPII